MKESACCVVLCCIVLRERESVCVCVCVPCPRAHAPPPSPSPRVCAGAITAVAVSGDGSLLCTGAEDHTIKVYDVNTFGAHSTSVMVQGEGCE